MPKGRSKRGGKGGGNNAKQPKQAQITQFMRDDSPSDEDSDQKTTNTGKRKLNELGPSGVSPSKKRMRVDSVVEAKLRSKVAALKTTLAKKNNKLNQQSLACEERIAQVGSKNETLQRENEEIKAKLENTTTCYNAAIDAAKKRIATNCRLAKEKQDKIDAQEKEAFELRALIKTLNTKIESSINQEKEAMDIEPEEKEMNNQQSQANEDEQSQAKDVNNQQKKNDVDPKHFCVDPAAPKYCPPNFDPSTDAPIIIHLADGTRAIQFGNCITEEFEEKYFDYCVDSFARNKETFQKKNPRGRCGLMTLGLLSSKLDEFTIKNPNNNKQAIASFKHIGNKGAESDAMLNEISEALGVVVDTAEHIDCVIHKTSGRIRVYTGKLSANATPEYMFIIAFKNPGLTVEDDHLNAQKQKNAIIVIEGTQHLLEIKQDHYESAEDGRSCIIVGLSRNMNKEDEASVRNLFNSFIPNGEKKKKKKQMKKGPAPLQSLWNLTKPSNRNRNNFNNRNRD
eukprot:153791_1